MLHVVGYQSVVQYLWAAFNYGSGILFLLYMDR
jgi:hypothetical protein